MTWVEVRAYDYFQEHTVSVRPSGGDIFPHSVVTFNHWITHLMLKVDLWISRLFLVGKYKGPSDLHPIRPRFPNAHKLLPSDDPCRAGKLAKSPDRRYSPSPSLLNPIDPSAPMMPARPAHLNDIPREIRVVLLTPIAIAVSVSPSCYSNDAEGPTCSCRSRWEDRVVCSCSHPYATPTSSRRRGSSCSNSSSSGYSYSRSSPVQRRESPPIQPRRSVDRIITGRTSSSSAPKLAAVPFGTKDFDDSKSPLMMASSPGPSRVVGSSSYHEECRRICSSRGARGVAARPHKAAPTGLRHERKSPAPVR
jgi:hypothetical protein